MHIHIYDSVVSFAPQENMEIPVKKASIINKYRVQTNIQYRIVEREKPIYQRLSSNVSLVQLSSEQTIQIHKSEMPNENENENVDGDERSKNIKNI